ncbi:MAG: methyltransferase domain-containing protein [Solirubrobacterales bacterium]
MDLDEYRIRSLANWDRLAGNWLSEREYLWETTGNVSRVLVERLDPQPGQTILEVAAGTGDTGFLAAESLGDDGRLISTDFSSGMVEKAQQVSSERGLTNVQHRILDAEQMDLEDDSVDGVISRFGYMLMADPAKALSETKRVLRDDGRLAFAVWATPDKNLWAAIPAMELVSRGHIPPPEPGGPGIFAMGEPDRIRELVAAGGLAEPEIEQITVDWGYPDADFHWAMTMKLAGPISEAIGGLDEDERESVRLTVRERVDGLINEGGIDGLVHVVTTS